MAALILNINMNYNIPSIVRAAGLTNVESTDGTDFWIDNIDLYVEGVTQAALDAALVAYELTYVVPPTLYNEKILAKQSIDHIAGQTRAKYITTTAGQAEIYLMKASEAESFITSGYPVDTTNYPFIAAEVFVTGKTHTQAADDIIAKRDQWKILGAAIEKERLVGKANVDNAVTELLIEDVRRLAIDKLEVL